MSMRRRLGLGLGLLGAVLAAPGCAQRDCERMGTCQDTDGGGPINTLNLQVVTTRLPRASGGALVMKAAAFKPGVSVTVTLTQGGAPVAVPLMPSDITEGQVQVQLSGAQLAALQAGAVDVGVDLGDQHGSGKIYLYLTPRMGPEAVLDYAVIGNITSPLRPAITQRGLVLVWESYTNVENMPRRRIGEYSFDAQSMKLKLPANRIKYLSNIDLSATAQVSFGRSDVAMALLTGGATYGLRRCQLIEATPEPCTTTTDTGLSAVSALALDPSGSLVGAGGGAALKAFSGMTNTAVALEPPPGTLAQIAAADLNGDAAADLLVVDAAGAASLLVAKGGALTRDDALSTEITTRLRTAGALATLAVADVDGDGLMDLALVTTTNPKEVRVIYNQGAGKFADATALATSASVITALASGDVDQDGDADLVVAASSDRRLGLFLNAPQ